ncbi:ScbR family autoregulator-binding transcription factor [Streptomyces sp. NPDC048594]|uniref:ScbR family autoregulator-binding transcription factor n=1 Tax=Streptomyces sp. NPDC048594 TaxID=3365575 RepID=UPI00371B2B5E
MRGSALDREFLMVKQERAARTRQALVRAAAEVFATEGFAHASLTSISRRAGVSNGALHFHFESKQALARAVEEAAAAALEAIGRAADGSDSSLQRLVDATYALMSSLIQDAVVSAGFGLSGGFPRRSGGVDVRERWRDWVEQVLREAELEGGLADGVSAADATVAVVAATVGLERLGTGDPVWTSEATLMRFWNLMIPRLAAPALAPRLLARGARPAPANRPLGAFTVQF